MSKASKAGPWEPCSRCGQTEKATARQTYRPSAGAKQKHGYLCQACIDALEAEGQPILHKRSGNVGGPRALDNDGTGGMHDNAVRHLEGD